MIDAESTLISNSSNVSNNPQNTSNATLSERSICAKYAYHALSHAVIVLNLLKKVMALFSTAFMIDCKFTEHGGHLGIQCTQQHTVKHIEDFATDSTFVWREGQRISISYLNKMDECYLPSCSAMHPEELEIIKRTHHNEYLKVTGNPCERENIICEQPSIDSKCGTMTRYCKNIRDWYTPIWWLENRSHVDPTAEGNAKHSRFTDCKNGNECCAFYVMPDINKSLWESIVDDEFLRAYCYVAGIYHSSHKQDKDMFHSDGHYGIGSVQLSWPQAKEFCEKRGGTLATPITRRDFEQAIDFCRIHGGYSGIYNNYWLGFHESESEENDSNTRIWRDTTGRITNDFSGQRNLARMKDIKSSFI